MASHTCVYCGFQSQTRFDKEHIIPEAIGGAVKIDRVCDQCNNDFSKIDNALCSDSPLSFVKNVKFDLQSPRLWTVDTASKNLLMEVLLERHHSRLIDAPQLILDDGRLQFRGDMSDMENLGSQGVRRFVFYARKAVRNYRMGKKRGLFFQAEKYNEELFQIARLPPRVFSQKRLQAINHRTTFKIRYLADRPGDREAILDTIMSIDPGVFDGGMVNARRPQPANQIRTYYDMRQVLGCLWKIGINLLVHICDHTKINRQSFPIIDVIAGRQDPPPACLISNGFVVPKNLQNIWLDENTHSIRVTNNRENHWWFHFAFFGGKVCAAVNFRGQNNEDWLSAEIHAPIKSDQWKIEKAKIWTPPPHCLITDDIRKIIPSFDFD